MEMFKLCPTKNATILYEFATNIVIKIIPNNKSLTYKCLTLMYGSLVEPLDHDLNLVK